VIADRDISIALGTRDSRASEICVRSVMSPRLFTCTPDDDVHTSLKTLASEGFRRLHVIDGHGMLMGVLPIEDVALNARADALTYRAILLNDRNDPVSLKSN
jgi:CBS-domain-containing membrane protein